MAGSIWGVLVGPFAVMVVALIFTSAQLVGIAWDPVDARIYFEAGQRIDDLYAWPWRAGEAVYTPPPPIAQVWGVIGVLGWPIAFTLWQLLNWWCLWYATRAFAVPVIAAGLIAIGTDVPLVGAPLSIVLLGNVGMMLTAGVVATVIEPRAVLLPALTKVGPASALLWHVRRPRLIVRGIAAVGAGLAVSFAIAPSSWVEWVDFVVHAGPPPIRELGIPFFVRAPVGILIVLVAAWLRRAWLVPLGAGLCLPLEYGSSFVTVWVGALALISTGKPGVPRPAALRAGFETAGTGVRIREIERQRPHAK